MGFAKLEGRQSFCRQAGQGEAFVRCCKSSRADSPGRRFTALPTAPGASEQRL